MIIFLIFHIFFLFLKQLLLVVPDIVLNFKKRLAEHVTDMKLNRCRTPILSYFHKQEFFVDLNTELIKLKKIQIMPMFFIFLIKIFNFLSLVSQKRSFYLIESEKTSE